MFNEINDGFNIGPIHIYYYGILILSAFFLTFFFSYLEWRKKGYSKYSFSNIFWMSAIVGIFGARIWYLIFNPSDIHSLLSFFQISQGRAIQGSVFFGTLAVYIYVSKFAPEVEWRYAFSILVPNILIGQAIGRWGNFYDQNVYGHIITDPSVGMFSLLPAYIREGMMIDGFYRQPLFLYEAFIDLTGWILINQIIKSFRVFKPGTHGGMYLLWYGTTRAIMEPHRDPEFIMKIGDIRTSFVLSIVFAIIGLLIIIYYQFFYKKSKFFFYYQRRFYLEFIRILLFSFSINRIKESRSKLNKNLNNVESERTSFYDSIYSWYLKGPF